MALLLTPPTAWPVDFSTLMNNLSLFSWLKESLTNEKASIRKSLDSGRLHFKVTGVSCDIGQLEKMDFWADDG